MPSSVTTRTIGLSPITAHFRSVIRIALSPLRYAHLNAFGQRGQNATVLCNRAVVYGRQCNMPPHVRDQRHDLDLGEVDAQSDALPAAERRQRVRTIAILVAWRQEAIGVEALGRIEHGVQPMASGDGQKDLR